MIFAIAALLFQIGPAVPAVPAAAATAAKAAAAQPAASIPALPDAPLPSHTSPNALPAPAASPDARSSAAEAVQYRAVALNSTSADAAALSSVRIVESNKPVDKISVEQIPSRREWIALSIAQSTAAGFDAYATRHAIQNGAREDDPFMRPFAGSSGIYAAIQVGPLMLDYTARHMQRSENPLLRHTWWLPQAVGTGMFLFAGTHDIQIASHH